MIGIAIMSSQKKGAASESGGISADKMPATVEREVMKDIKEKLNYQAVDLDEGAEEPGGSAAKE